MTAASWKTAIAGLALVCAASGAAAQEVKLLFASTLPAGTSGPKDLIAPWIERVDAHAKGVLVVEQRDGPNIATMGNSYDRVMNDVVQIAWGLQPLLGGKFPLSEVAGLPFIGDNCEDSAVALWRLYKTGLLDSEYQNVVPLWLVPSAPNKLHFAKAPKGPVELKGLKINVFNRILVQVVQAFGGTPVSIAPEQQYEGLQRGVMDAALTAWAGFEAYKLQEVTTYHTEASLGSSVHMLFMSRKRFEALPPAARQAIEDESGEVESRIHGQFWDMMENIQRDKVASMPKQTIVRPTPTEVEEWQAKTAPIIEDWAKGRTNGEKVLATYREILAQVRAEKKG